jgi:hypothetical protein
VFSFGIGTALKAGAQVFAQAMDFIFRILGKTMKLVINAIKIVISALDDVIDFIKAIAQFFKRAGKKMSGFFDKLEEFFQKFKEYLKRKEKSPDADDLIPNDKDKLPEKHEKKSSDVDEVSKTEDGLKGLIKDSRGIYGYLPKEGSRYYKFFDKFMDVDWVARQRLIRQDYLKQSKVLEQTITTMKANQKTPEQIARHVVEQRNLQKVEARSHMLPEEIKALEEGNLKLYDNPIGPSADDLFESKGSWEAVIEGSMKKDQEINTLLGL